MRRVWLAVGFWLGLASLADAGVIHLTACDGTTLANAVTNAMSGDIIYLPATTCIITNAPVVLNVEGKHLTILGRGIDVTFFQDNTAASHPRTFTFRTSPTTCLTFGHFTVLGGSGEPTLRFAGMYGSGTSLEGPGTTCMRLTHIKRTYDVAGSNNLFYVAVYGVADNIEYGIGIVANSNPFELEQGGMWDEEAITNGAWGDVSWMQPTSVSWNGPKALYIEDSTFTTTDNDDGKNLTDQTMCGRSVTRYNTMDNWGTTSHGTESGDRQRGSCWIGFYRNVANWDTMIPGFSQGSWIDMRAGTGAVHDNTITLPTGILSATVGAVFNRRSDHFTWGACDGKHHWDDNDLTAPVYTGQHKAPGTNGSITLVDPDANGGAGFPDLATPNTGLNNWAIINTSQFCAPATAAGHPTCVRAVTDNTATTITRSTSTNSVWSFNLGDNYEVRRINWCMDQTGSGPARIYYTGGNLEPDPLLGNVRPIEPARNSYEPVWIWNNTKNGSPFNVAGGGSFHAETIPVFMKGSPRPGYTEWIYRCPNGQLAGTDDNGCLAKGGTFNGKQSTCLHHNGCGHPLRWVNSQLHVHGRQAIAAVQQVPVAALELRAVAALERRNVE